MWVVGGGKLTDKQGQKPTDRQDADGRTVQQTQRQKQFNRHRDKSSSTDTETKAVQQTQRQKQFNRHRDKSSSTDTETKAVQQTQRQKQFNRHRQNNSPPDTDKRNSSPQKQSNKQTTKTTTTTKQQITILATCTQGPVNSTVTLTFHDFDIEGVPGKCKDSVEISTYMFAENGNEWVLSPFSLQAKWLHDRSERSI